MKWNRSLIVVVTITCFTWLMVGSNGCTFSQDEKDSSPSMDSDATEDAMDQEGGEDGSAGERRNEDWQEEVDREEAIRDSLQKAMEAEERAAAEARLREREEAFIRNAPTKLLEALSGLDIPIDIKERLTILELSYFGMDSVYHHDGLLVVEKSSARAVEKVFNQLKRDSFPIESIIPVNAFGWDDDKSMRANNTSCFNYRSAVGSGRLSEHAYGHAIDINPLINPFYKGGKVYPSNGVYIDTIPGTILAGDPVIQYFAEIGWKWGGDWKNSKDYQHFSKNGR